MQMALSSYRTKPMQVERIEEMRLTSGDEKAIADLLARAFGTDFGGRSFYQNRHHVRLVVRDGDAVIGHIALGLRAIRMGDRLLQAAGVAEVATDPAHRGKGIATALLAATIAEARWSSADVLILFGDQPLYAASGFEAKPNRTRSISMHGVRTGPLEDRQADGLMVMPLRDTAWDDSALIDLVGFAF